MNKEWSLKDQIYSDFLNLCDEETLINLCSENGSDIMFINKPSKKVQLAAVKEWHESIRYIKNPSEKVQLEAVKYFFNAILSIENPSKNVQLSSINNGIKFNLFNDYDYLENFLQKINHIDCLLKLYHHVDIDCKNIIKKSPYWKDDANLILEVINE